MKQSFPQTSLFQENWQSQRGTDLFNPNALQIESAKEFMRSYTNDFRLQLNEEIIPLEWMAMQLIQACYKQVQQFL